MNPLRSKAMIASAMSFVRPIRPTGRRRAVADANDVGAPLSAASNEPFGPGRYAAIPDLNTIDPPSAGTSAECLASGSGPISVDSTARAASTSYSLIGW
ncbi:hypothetical protein EV643_10146 [Kribbella sp. VKM Ac-2527]|uniref:Uncharacterized protein n=1 Tax=Kribbella caucasensis TaxID=2512215 RepID=A0A4R6KNR1_9ACTN|nr:hypothetical protein [Kribbella sp. VKM Ac-2527]TDO54265.1 hypothetical protein EV643_10146 [Kribbella sp. VKM Ac-2527]